MVTIEESGNYLLLVEGRARDGAIPWLFRITPGGVLSKVQIMGAMIRRPLAITPAGPGKFAITAWEDMAPNRAVFTLTSDGTMTKVFNLPESTEGLAIDPETGETIIALPYSGSLLR